MKEIKRGDLVIHKMKNLQVFNYDSIYYPRDTGIVLEVSKNFFTVFWKDSGIQKEERFYLDLVY
jgi:hypothetical protein